MNKLESAIYWIGCVLIGILSGVFVTNILLAGLLAAIGCIIWGIFWFIIKNK
jgi:hypothetical protein